MRPRRRSMRSTSNSCATTPRRSATPPRRPGSTTPASSRRDARQGPTNRRENLNDLVDDGSFVEYGPLVIAAQRQRRSVDDLIERTRRRHGRRPGHDPGRGGRADRARAVVLSTTTHGAGRHQGIRTTGRSALRTGRAAAPAVVLFAGGAAAGRATTDTTTVSGLDTMAFHLFGRLAGTVPLVGIASGRLPLRAMPPCWAASTW